MDNRIDLGGNLSYISLGDLLQFLGSNGSTGELRIRSPYSAETGLLCLSKGNVVDANLGKIKGIDAIYQLFGWLSGQFEFVSDSIERVNVIKQSRMEIILNALRLLDDGAIPKLGPTTSTPAKSKTAAQGGDSAFTDIIGPPIEYMYVVDEEEYSDGDIIVQQGSHGSWFWVILEGMVEIIKETSRGPVHLVRIKEGGFIGNTSTLLKEGIVRSATVRAVGNVQLGVVDSQRLAGEYNKLSPEFKTLIVSINKRLIEVTDKTVDIIHKVNNLKVDPKELKPFIKQGNNDTQLFEITKGAAFLFRKPKNTGPIYLANLSQGDYIGHIPFLDLGHEPHMASVLITKEFACTRRDASVIQKEYEALSTMFKNILNNSAACISVTTNIACKQ
ncbi:MAG: cyclic nucleotide-binding domain-containing protein [Desulfobacterales bacterium]|nr:cyclic nucleotide-binding domain-containing protein [Desulfobacterales bacterium]